MKRYLSLVVFLAASTYGLHAQATDATVCDVLKNPQSFDNKIVRIKGTVTAGFDQFVIHDADCGQDVNGIWLSYPQGTKAKAGPVAMLELKPAKNFGGAAASATARTPVTVDKSKDFKEFDNQLSQLHNEGSGICMGCVKNEVTATIVGRIDGVASVTLKRDPNDKILSMGGFGNMNAYPARLVIQSVSDVAAKPVDFAKVDAIMKGDQQQGPPGQQQSAGGGGDALQAAQKFAAAQAGKPLGDQLGKAVGTYPKQGEQNGVTISYGPINEVAASEAPATQDSPDGVLYEVTLNKDRIKSDAQMFAVIHMGQHIADERTPVKGNEMAPVRLLENNGWVVSTESAMFSGIKYVVLPGGYMMWNTKWPQDEQISNMTDALRTFLTTEEMMTM